MAKELSTVKIVSYDWLEESLLSKTRRPKAEGPYLLKNLLKAEAQNGRKRKRDEEQKPSKKRICISHFPSAGFNLLTIASDLVDPFVHKKTTKCGRPAAPRMFECVW